MALNIGDKAPEVLGLNQDGKEIKLSDFQGKKIVLYFIQKITHQVVQLKHAIYAIIMKI